MQPHPSISGNNGIIDGQGSVWWDWLCSHELNHSHPHLVEFLHSAEIVVSNLTFLNSPAWSIHPVYCRCIFFIKKKKVVSLTLCCVIFFGNMSCTNEYFYCLSSNVKVHNVTVHISPDAPLTGGIVPGIVSSLDALLMSWFSDSIDSLFLSLYQMLW